jgi:hypothetical protein
MRIQNVLVTTAALAGLAFVGSLMTPPQAVAQNPSPGSAPVNIVSPLPLPVSISGTPTINFANTAANPLLVRDVDNPARNFVRLNFNVAQPAGTGSGLICFESGYTVPAGKRLVIDDVSARTGGPSSTITGLFIDLTVNAANVGTPCTAAAFFVKQTIGVVPFTFQGFDSLGSRYAAAHESTQFYVETGETIGGSLANSAFVLGQAVTYIMHISGHLVSIP